VAIQAAACRAIIEQTAQRHIAIKCGEGVLQRDAVPAFIKMHRVKAERPFHKRIGNERLRHDTVRAAGMSAQAARTGHRRKKDDGVPHDLDIGQ